MRYFLLVTILLFTTCKKDVALHEINNLNNNQIYAFGHGGMGIVNIAPIDSYQSVIRSMDFNPHGIEIDVQLTADGHLVAYHHEKLDDHTNGKGFIRVNNIETILNLHYVVGPINNYTLFSLDNFFEKEPRAKDFLWDFDVKLYAAGNIETYLNEFNNALKELIEEHDLEGQVFIESQSPLFIEMMQETNIPAELFYYVSDPEKGIETADSLDIYGISINNNLISKEQIREAHDSNLRVMLFDTQTPEENADAIKKSPDFLITGNLKHLMAVLN